jgi:hypothetical protein
LSCIAVSHPGYLARIAYRYVENALQKVREGELAVADTPIRVVLSEMLAEQIGLD